MFHVTDTDLAQIEQNVDENGDSYARDISIEELKQVGIFHSCPKVIKNSRFYQIWYRKQRMESNRPKH